MGDTLTCANIKKAVKILNEHKIELPHVLYISGHWLKNKEMVDYVKWGARVRRFSTYFVDKDNNITKSFIMDKIN